MQFLESLFYTYICFSEENVNLTNKVIEFSSCMMQRPGYGVIMGVYFSIRFVLVIVHYLYSDIIYIRRTNMVCIKYTWVDIQYSYTVHCSNMCFITQHTSTMDIHSTLAPG